MSAVRRWDLIWEDAEEAQDPAFMLALAEWQRLTVEGQKITSVPGWSRNVLEPVWFARNQAWGATLRAAKDWWACEEMKIPGDSVAR